MTVEPNRLRIDGLPERLANDEELIWILACASADHHVKRLTPIERLRAGYLYQFAWFGDMRGMGLVYCYGSSWGTMTQTLYTENFLRKVWRTGWSVEEIDTMLTVLGWQKFWAEVELHDAALFPF